MRKEELDFELPDDRIARQPCERREDSRLLVHHCRSASSEHRSFAELADCLRAGDLLVLNDTKVVPARLALRKESGGKVEGLWLQSLPTHDEAELLLSGGRLRPGVRLCAEDGVPLIELLGKLPRGRWRARSLLGEWGALLERVGEPPLPPYIRRMRVESGEDETQAADRERYQTLWAQHAGSVAAPTASLHFSEAILHELEQRGVQTAALTLHVGMGTFLPIEEDDVRRHRMHAERFAISEACADAVQSAQREGRRIIAAGTTVARVLESVPLPMVAAQGATELFVLPGRRLQVLDGLLTNFHTPQSTLLALVAACCEQFGGKGLAQVKQVYAEAIKRSYRFYSYGDASLWLR